VPTLLYSHDGTTPWIAAFYSGYFAILAATNESLWLATISSMPTKPWRLVIGPGILALVFIIATMVSFISPLAGAMTWLAVILAPLADARATKSPL
jgi:hypothetical protein